jgi:predicted peroxiredoxin
MMLLRIGVVAAGICMLTQGTLLAQAAGEKARDGVFIHVSHGAEHPQRVLMALSMAEIMAEDRDVLVYFDIKGVEVVVQGAKDLHYKHFTSSKKQLKSLAQKGVTLMACPGCLKAAGKSAKDLAPGIEIADKDRFFSFTKGRILTLDY